MQFFQTINVNFSTSDLSWVAKIVQWLIGITSSVAFGVILFTLVLKLITSPFDFFSRYSMRKNSVIMEQMRPELEKLQKQYADDKTLYNQKMMAIYKKNGYSMWGSCLPTILTLVIFIVAINGFSSYSNYQNREYFYEMSKSYNSVCYDGFNYDGDYIIKNKDGSYKIKTDKQAELLTEGTHGTLTVTKSDDEYNITSTDGYIGMNVVLSGEKPVIKYYVSDYSKVNSSLTPETLTNNEEEALEFLKEVASEKSAAKYREQQAGFLWVKNIWITDSPLEHPVYEKYASTSQGCGSCFGQGKGFSTFGGNFFKGASSSDAEIYYTELTKNLKIEKSQPNGYFILCVLTAGITFLMQLVMSKSQKAQMELQTVDGQGARQQQMMMWMMPILMAFFSFMYTAAFSIYLILSSLISIGTTFLINWIVDKKLGKAKAGANGKAEVVRNKSFVIDVKKREQKEQEAKDKKKNKEKKDKKTNDEEKGDFLK